MYSIPACELKGTV